MKQRFVRASQAAARWLGGRSAWWVVLGLFLVEALWFVFSAQYPMAFDENYHFGLIQLHAQQWLPFFTSQPHDAGVYGAIVRDPSYLYHWLMSFPYRLIMAITGNQTAQIIALRLMNVAMFAGALLLFRRIIRRLGVSTALATCMLAVFVMIPSVPFLAAHINYDNLFFVVVGITVILALRLVEGFRAGRVDALALGLLLATMFAGGLIKYPYLPVMLVTVLFAIWHAWRSGLISLRGLHSFTASYQGVSLVRRIAVTAMVVLLFTLFAERYVANVVTYHDPVPACDAVISQDECMQYGPYGRDYLYVQQKPANFHANVLGYAVSWVWGMWYRLFFAVNYNYATAPPLLVLAWTAVLLAVLLGVGIVLQWRYLFAESRARQFLGLLIVGYVLVLFMDGFSSYSKTGQPVAVNGRYLIPFLPLLFALGGLAWTRILQRRTGVKIAVATVVFLVFFTQGGGGMTFLIRSSDTWFWDNNIVRNVNHTARSAVWPFILGRGNY